MLRRNFPPLDYKNFSSWSWMVCSSWLSLSRPSCVPATRPDWWAFREAVSSEDRETHVGSSRDFLTSSVQRVIYTVPMGIVKGFFIIESFLELSNFATEGRSQMNWGSWASKIQKCAPAWSGGREDQASGVMTCPWLRASEGPLGLELSSVAKLTLGIFCFCFFWFICLLRSYALRIPTW